jgi:hypothetical protein
MFLAAFVASAQVGPFASCWNCSNRTIFFLTLFIYKQYFITYYNKNVWYLQFAIGMYIKPTLYVYNIHVWGGPLLTHKSIKTSLLTIHRPIKYTQTIPMKIGRTVSEELITNTVTGELYIYMYIRDIYNNRRKFKWKNAPTQSRNTTCVIISRYKYRYHVDIIGCVFRRGRRSFELEMFYIKIIILSCKSSSYTVSRANATDVIIGRTNTCLALSAFLANDDDE